MRGHSQCTAPCFPCPLSCPKAPRNSPHGPILTAATIRGGKKKKKKKCEQARKASLHPICTGRGRSPPRASRSQLSPQPNTAATAKGK